VLKFKRKFRRQRVKVDNKESFIHATCGGVQVVGSIKRSVLWKTLGGLILIKEAVICNTDWRVFLLSSSSPIMSEKESQLEGRVKGCVRLTGEQTFLS